MHDKTGFVTGTGGGCRSGYGIGIDDITGIGDG